jgi:hypothetical protein
MNKIYREGLKVYRTYMSSTPINFTVLNIVIAECTSEEAAKAAERLLSL